MIFCCVDGHNIGVWGYAIDLNFNPFEIVAVIMTNSIGLDGRSNWLEGALLLATYTILAAAFYFLPI